MPIGNKKILPTSMNLILQLSTDDFNKIQEIFDKSESIKDIVKEYLGDAIMTAYSFSIGEIYEINKTLEINLNIRDQYINAFHEKIVIITKHSDNFEEKVEINTEKNISVNFTLNIPK